MAVFEYSSGQQNVLTSIICSIVPRGISSGLELATTMPDQKGRSRDHNLSVQGAESKQSHVVAVGPISLAATHMCSQ